VLEVIVARGARERRFVLRELCGADELGLPERSPSARVAASVLAELVGSLVVRERSCSGFAEASVAERDRIYAALCRALFGDRVEARAVCDGCGEAYELGFELSSLERARPVATSDAGDVAIEGTSTRVRPPTVGELEAWGDAVFEQFRAHCVVREGAPERAESAADPADPADATDEVDEVDEVDDETLDSALEAAAPLLDMHLEAPCPACGRARRERFEIGAWLMSGLLRERRVTLQELHVLARAYGWSLESLLALTRSQRHAFVRLVTRAEARP
jgi:hypothetical protein